MSKLPYPESAAIQYPPGITPHKRKIISCGDKDPKCWYRNKIGTVVNVHYFVTFGAWTTDGKWLWYYDLSGPVK